MARKSFHISRVTIAPLMAFSQNMSVQIKADPSVIYKRVNFLGISVVGFFIDSEVELD